MVPDNTVNSSELRFGRARKAAALGAKFVRVSRELGAPLWRSTPRFVSLLGSRRFSPSEVWSLALLDPGLSARRLASYVSKDFAWPLYERCNRNEWMYLLNDKVAFHTTCHQLGLETLGCERVIGPEDLADLRRRMISDVPEGLESWLGKMPENFVVKPIDGYHGDGVRFFRREEGTLRIFGGPVIGFRDFVSELEAIASTATLVTLETGRTPAENRMMFQKMGFAHPEISELSGKDVMQSVRICTYLDPQGRPEILFAFLKIIAGEALIDNFQRGKTGNLIADLDRESGRVMRAIRFDPQLGASRPVERHPATHRNLVGFAVPGWEAICDLALRAAVAFPRTRAVGWDVGISAEGPVLLEGNGTWDPVSPFFRPLPAATP